MTVPYCWQCPIVLGIIVRHRLKRRIVLRNHLISAFFWHFVEIWIKIAMYILRRWIYRLKSDPWKEPVFSSSVDISHRGTSHRCNLQDASLAHTQQEKKDISHLGEGCWERSHLRRRPRRPRWRRRQRRVGQSNLATGDGRRYRPLYPLSSIRVDHSLDHPSPFYYSPYHDTVTLLSTHGDRPSCRVPLLFILTLLLPLLVHHCLST